jgi:hypothetical protein
LKTVQPLAPRAPDAPRVPPLSSKIGQIVRRVTHAAAIEDAEIESRRLLKRRARSIDEHVERIARLVDANSEIATLALFGDDEHMDERAEGLGTLLRELPVGTALTIITPFPNLRWDLARIPSTRESLQDRFVCATVPGDSWLSAANSLMGLVVREEQAVAGNIRVVAGIGEGVEVVP